MAGKTTICGRVMSRHTAQTPCHSLPAPILCGQTMTSKRLRSDSSDLPNTPKAALATIHQLIRQFRLDPAMLKDDDSGLGRSLFRLGVWLC